MVVYVQGWPSPNIAIKKELCSSYITIRRVVLLIYYSNLKCCCIVEGEISPNQLFRCLFVLCWFYFILRHYLCALSTHIHRKSPNTSIYYEVQPIYMSTAIQQLFTFNCCWLGTINNNDVFSTLSTTPCPLIIYIFILMHNRCDNKHSLYMGCNYICHMVLYSSLMKYWHIGSIKCWGRV